MWSGKCPFGEISGLGIVRRGNVRSGKCPFGEMSVGEMSVGELSVGEMSGNLVNIMEPVTEIGITRPTTYVSAGLAILVQVAVGNIYLMKRNRQLSNIYTRYKRNKFILKIGIEFSGSLVMLVSRNFVGCIHK